MDQQRTTDLTCFVQRPRFSECKCSSSLGTIRHSRVLGNRYGYLYPLTFSGNGRTKFDVGVAVDLFSELLDCGDTGKAVCVSKPQV